MAKTLKDLTLALLNATLILLALCLFLAWKVVDRAGEVGDRFSQAVQVVTPLRTEMQTIGTELGEVHQALTTLDKSATPDAAPQLAEIKDELAALNAKLSGAQSRIEGLSDEPGQLIDKAIETTADAFSKRLSALRGCAPEPS